MKYRLAVFDMDGTILDTLDDITNSINHALTKEAYPQRTKAEIRRFVGSGAKKLVERALPIGVPTFEAERIYDLFCSFYAEHCNLLTRPYSGIKDAIKQIRSFGVKTAVVSNKPDIAVQPLCEQFFPELFDFSTGTKEGVLPKPSADMVNEALSVLGFSRSDAVYIGDSEVDVETAKNSGMDLIAVEWGFRDKAELISCGAASIVSHPLELVKKIC